MSLEEDTELRDLVLKTLESNRMLSKIKAQLRATIFLALEEESTAKDKIQLRNNDLIKFSETRSGKMLLLLISDFLEHFNLEFTKSVFEAEANLNLINDDEKNDILNEINSNENKKVPLLLNILSNNLNTNEIVNDLKSMNITDDENLLSNCTTPQPITEIRTTVKNINNRTYIKYNSDSLSSNLSEETSSSSNAGEKSNSVVDECIESTNDDVSINDNNYLIDFSKSIQETSSPMVVNIDEDNKKTLLDETIVGSSDKESSPKVDKLKPFSLSSLQDLPPIINVTKTKSDTVLLPSLYTKKDKKNVGE